MFTLPFATPVRLEAVDHEVQLNVRAALRAADKTRALDYNHIEAEVRDGIVWLRGHVGSPQQKREAEQSAGGAVGVTGVNNRLVIDAELEIAVAQALAAYAPTRACMLSVGATAGWVQLGGLAPDAAVRAAAGKVAASVPGVRGVLSLPHLPGEQRDLDRHRTLQPRAGSLVFAADGQIGAIAGVIVDPGNRLVSHIVVDARLNLRWREVYGQFVIPAEAIRLSSPGETLLTDTIAAVSVRPRFRAADFRRPPADWQLPFPYHPAEVQWPV